MKSKNELQPIIDQIASPDIPVGDAVYVHAVILDHLERLGERLGRLEEAVEAVKKRIRDATWLFAGATVNQ